MSVRRLADEAVQPAGFAFNEGNSDWAERRIALYPEGRQQSAVIPLLMRAQEQEGWVSRAVIERVAEMLGMPYIRVLEVATFYTQFQLQPVGTRAHVQVCGTTPCMLRGAEELRAVCQRKIHHDSHHTNDDGTLSWEEVECLGACVNAPMVAIGMDTYEDLTPERLEEIIDAFAEGKGDTIAPGPQNGRVYSAPSTGFTTLTEVPERHPAHEHDEGGVSAAGQEATTPGRMRDVPPESAPSLKGPTRARKVSMAEAEEERLELDEKAKATGEPNRAMREDAVGAESPAITPPEERAPQKSGPNTSAVYAAPDGEPDDLKRISGVTPTLEKKLNALGITQFSQIAGFGKADLKQVDDMLNLEGRTETDEWAKQARTLAEGRVGEDGDKPERGE